MKRLLMCLAVAAMGCGSASPQPRDAIAALGAHAELEPTDVSCASGADGDIPLGGVIDPASIRCPGTG